MSGERIIMYRIAVVSDIHYGKFSRTLEFSVPGEEIKDDNRGAVSLQDGLIKILKDMQVEYLCVAGDLTSVASPQEFHYCEEKLLYIANKVGISEEHIVCCLGNHDIDRNITKLSDNLISEETEPEVAALIKESYNLIAANCATSNLKKLNKSMKKIGPVPYSMIYEEEQFIVFVLNSGWLCTHDQDYPHGKLAESQLTWFRKLAETFKEDSRKKILLMHHHPVNYQYPLPVADISALEEGSEIINIANTNGIDIIIHGHRHHPIARTLQIRSGAKPITLLCAGSLSVNSLHRNNGEIPNTLHILELDEEDQTIILYNYKYTGATGWEEVKFCDEIPLDHKMKLGRIYTSEQIEDEIVKLPKTEGGIVTWDNLNECLQYITYKELNDKVKEKLSEKYRVIGVFPNDVCFLEKEEK